MPTTDTTLVRLLAWVYRDQRADIMMGDDFTHPPTNRIDLPHVLTAGDRGSWAKLAPQVELGAAIRSTGHLQRAVLHPDAEAVHQVMHRLWREDWLVAALVFQHARTGDVPSWQVEPMGWEPALGWKTDTVAVPMAGEVVDIRNKHGQLVEATVYHTPVRPYPGAEMAELARAVYQAWHRGLERTFVGLRSVRLQRWALTRIGAVPAPWLAGQGAEGGEDWQEAS